MHLSLRLKSIGFMLRFFPLVIYSAMQRIEFLVPFLNLMLKLLAKPLNLIHLSINYILGFSFSFFNTANSFFYFICTYV